MAGIVLSQWGEAMKKPFVDAFVKWTEEDPIRRQRGHKNARGVPMELGAKVLTRTKRGMEECQIASERRTDGAFSEGWGPGYEARFPYEDRLFYVKETSIVWWPGKPGKKPTK